MWTRSRQHNGLKEKGRSSGLENKQSRISRARTVENVDFVGEVDPFGCR